MYTVSVKQDFIARHYLIEGDRGPENECHSHHYVIEVRLEGLGLDQRGYLVDIDNVNACLNELIETYSEKVLNELPEFENRNPSLEIFARILHTAVADRFKDQPLRGLAVRLWEDELAWAGYRETY